MITGEKRENNFEIQEKRIGLFNSKILVVNPSREEYKDILGIDLKEDSKATEYLGEKDGITTLRLNIWVEDVKTGFKNPITFLLMDKERTNKDQTKNQYINSTGTTSWADEPSNLQDWFQKTDYRKAMVGEEELYKFLRTAFIKVDFKKEGATLKLDWKKLMKGNVNELRNDLKYSDISPVGVMAIVKTVEKDGETKEYQGIYNREFLPDFALKQFRLVDYTNEELLNVLRKKKSKELKAHEKFAVAITDSSHGCSEIWSFKDLHNYNPEEHFQASGKVIDSEDSSY